MKEKNKLEKVKKNQAEIIKKHKHIIDKESLFDTQDDPTPGCSYTHFDTQDDPTPGCTYTDISGK